MQSTVSNGLASPTGVTVDGAGNLYIADSYNNQIIKETFSAGGYSQSVLLSISDPLGIAIDGSGNLYISDGIDNQVVKESPSGGGYAATVVAPNGSSLLAPQGVAVDGSGNVYIADSQNNRVLKETLSNGAYSESTVRSNLADPLGVAVDGGGSVYILDTFNHQVLKETPSNGAYSESTVTSGLNEALGIAVDAGGSVYIANYADNEVLKETPSQGQYTQSTVGGSIQLPVAIATNAKGDVFIAEQYFDSVLKQDVSDAPNLQFASTPFGTTGADSPQTVTVENIGNAALTFPIPSAGNNPSIASNFTLDSSGSFTCPLVTSGSAAAGTLAAGTTCELPISFAPTSVGSWSGSLALTDDNLNAIAPNYSSQVITLNGTATQVTPTITWATPAPITYGVALSTAQLDASSSVAGKFSYSPASGSILAAGTQTLTTTFSPTDKADYTTATESVTLTVNKAAPSISWPTPSSIAYGTALSTKQLNATASVPGTFVYAPAAGTVLPVGPNTLTVTFTPTNSSNYTTVTASVVLTVTPAPGFTLSASPTALSITQGSNASSTIVITPVAGFTGKVKLAASGLPNGVTASFSANPATTTSVLTLKASAKAATGTVAVKVTGTSGNLTQSVTLNVTIVSRK
jgi:hypothetical protein